MAEATTTNGSEYEIPATRRSDGSWRKARRVKPGFVPQEEVPLYMPKGKRNLVQQQTSYPPGWHPSTDSTSGKKKTEKKEVATKQAPEIKIKTRESVIKPSATIETKPPPSHSMDHETEVNDTFKELEIEDSIDPTIELSKKLKRLRRRLRREIDALEEKIKSEGKSIDKDQLEKASRRKELQNEIQQLEEERLKLREAKNTKTSNQQ